MSYRSLVELIPDRLYMGPMPNKKSIPVKELLNKPHDFTAFVNLCSSEKARWYMPNNTLIESLHEFALKGEKTVCLSLEMNSEEPLKDDIIFKFVSKLAVLMKDDPKMKMYIHCYDGKWCSGTIALCLWSFLMDDSTKFDPIKEVKSMGKHDIVKKKLFVDQIKRVCARDTKSLHKYFVKKRKIRK